MAKNISKKLKIAFFGTSQFAVNVLTQLESELLPDLIITNPDKPAGRKLKLTPPPVKIWADENNIETQQPEKLDNHFVKELSKSTWDLFIVAAYGGIIPQSILDLPKHKTINIHPSLLPKLRGATPIHSAILGDEQETGVSIILLDEKMDHGPIIAQEKFQLYRNSISELPTKSELEKQLAILGGRLLNKTIPQWSNKEILAQEQNHNQATYIKKLASTDGLINLSDRAELNFKKIQAFNVWPKAHFFLNNKRIIIKKAHLKNDELIIDRVIPEGGKEIDYSNLLK
ncbi:MAG: methionyl-tRNA formyltransferase [Patescibacteria group bacterium]|nr:methionyl-tRNA formyltransferase [Patescibacteria group bacterium]